MASSAGNFFVWALFYSAVALFLATAATASVDQDRAECSDQLIGLATCLPYVGGDAKTPSIDCCTGLKLVVQKSKKCLCVLIKDKDDPNLGLKINGTLALGLPDACHAPINITECITLLHLAPNSTEAKIFKQSSSTSTPVTSATPVAKGPGNSPSSEEKSDGGMGKKWSVAEMVSGILLGFFTLWHLNLRLLFI